MKLFNKQPLDYSLAKQDKYDVVDADDVVAGRDQPVAEVAAEEAGAAGDENPLHRRHRRPPGPGTAFNAAATPPG